MEHTKIEDREVQEDVEEKDDLIKSEKELQKMYFTP